LASEDVNIKYKLDLPNFETRKLPIKMGDYKSLFDLYFERDKINWINWLKTIPPFVVPKDVSYSQLIVPTMDSIRMTKLLYTLIVSDKHPMICGPTGTGKSISIANELKHSFDNQDYAYLSMSFSA
jgi:dynein heavy chain